MALRRFTLLVAILLLAARPCAALVSPTPFLTLHGEVPGDRFGCSVAANGDVNGDGHEDIVAGAMWNDADALNAGRAYVFLGGPARDDAIDFVLQSPLVQGRALTGYSVAITGDINEDGWNDIAVGSPVSEFMGRVFLYWGGPNLNQNADRVLGGLEFFEFFGGSVAGVGDVDNDGHKDLWVGAPMFSPNGLTRVGRGYFFYGGPNADGVTDLFFPARPINDVTNLFQYGTSVASAGDVNGDGLPDILVGQPADGIVTAGRGYVYYGANITVHRVPDRILLAPEFRYRAGTSVSSAGDFNDDGRLDQVIGAPDSGVEGVKGSGRAYVFYGKYPSDLILSPDLEIKGPETFDAFGTSVAGGVDVSGDGLPDILVGAPQANGTAGEHVGRVYVYYGGPGADAVPDAVLEGPIAEGLFGTSLSLGDIDGDGTADAIVGATPVGSTTDPGHVYVYNLATTLAARAFAHDEDRTIPLNEQGAPICLRIEPMDDDFDVQAVDPASVRLSSDESGLSITASAAKRIVVSDTDGNGVGEFGACFERADLARLFPGPGRRRDVTVSLTGSLVDGRSFAADVSLTIVRTGPETTLEASVVPNPLNPSGALVVTLKRPGTVEARLFDPSGRMIRTLAAGIFLEAGTRRIVIDGRDDFGRSLPSGIYFYRLRTLDGELRGRVVIAK